MDQLSSTDSPTSSKRTRRQYTPEFRAKVVALSSQPEWSVARVAREHGINANLLHKWRRAAEPVDSPIAERPAFMPVSLPNPGNKATVHFELNGLSIDWPLAHIDLAIPWMRALQL
ncbi:IS66-like element accessory protein TnpA [Teredinibacter turnerae]|uniref:IS66-like element accessory protein TnpA n=1 Tax=Teredinibacter turnerae TaxID=2426 RepID=UPI0030D18F1E